MRILFVSIISGLMVLSAVAQEPVADAVPEIVCDQPVFNFGEMDNSQVVEHTFVVKNAGDGNLNITRVRPSCGCTVAHLSSDTLKPGEEAEITTKLNLHGRHGFQKKAITVECNDPKRPRLVLYLEGQATTGIELSPRRVSFGQITMDQQETRTVALKAVSQPTKILEVSTRSPYLDVAYETVEEGREYKIIVTTKPPMREEMMRANVEVKTDNPQNRKVNITVSASIIGDLVVAPREIILATNVGRPMTRYIMVRPGQVQDFEVTDVIVPVEGINTEIKHIGQNAGYRIRLDNINVTEDMNGKEIRIKTNIEGKDDIVIPIVVRPGTPPGPPPSSRPNHPQASPSGPPPGAPQPPSGPPEITQ